jgi:glucose dehydrogenase
MKMLYPKDVIRGRDIGKESCDDERNTTKVQPSTSVRISRYTPGAQCAAQGKYAKSEPDKVQRGLEGHYSLR